MSGALVFTVGTVTSAAGGDVQFSGSLAFVQVSAINGQATPAPTTIHYLFSTAGVAGSSATLDLLRQVSARPAFLLRLRR